ncbi:hypothetical protein Nmel_004521, partial [Mimus melanotis]
QAARRVCAERRPSLSHLTEQSSARTHSRQVISTVFVK